MMLDAQLTFNSTFGTATGISSTGTGTVIDLTGAGSGNLPTRMIGGVNGGTLSSNTAIGADIGYGDGEAIPYLYIISTAAGTGAGTVTFYLESAPDNGSGSPGTYTKLWTGASLTGSLVTAGKIYQLPVPPGPVQAPPRFYQLGWTVSSTASVTVLAGLTINPDSYAIGQQYPANYIAA